MLAAVSDSLKVFEFKSPVIEFNVISERSGFSGRLNTATWNHTNQVVAVAGTDRIIHLIQASNGQLLSEVPFSNSQERAILHSDSHILNDITSIAFSNSSRYLASSSGNSVHIWDLKKRNLRAFKPVGKSTISAVLFMPDGSKVISGNQEGLIDVWDFEGTSDVSGLISSEFVPTSLTCLDISLGTQTKLSSGYVDGKLSIWDMATCVHLRRQSVHDGKLTGLSFSPKNSRLLATAGHDGRINLVDTASKSTSDPSASVSVGERLTCISFSDDAIHSAVGTENGRIIVYDWRNLRSSVCAIEAFTPSPGLIKPSNPPSAKKPEKPSTIQESSSYISVASNISDFTENSAVSSSPMPPQPPQPPKPSSKSPAKLDSASDSFASSTVKTTPGKYASPKKSDDASTSRSVISSNLYKGSIGENNKSSIQQEGEIYNTSSSGAVSTAADDDAPLTLSKLREALDIFRYDIHKELQVIIREQVRQFAIAKNDNLELFQQMSIELKDLLEANKALREENERLRHIY